MTGPQLSLAQIRNRLGLSARTILRRHLPGSDGRCRACRIPECRVATAARDVLDATERLRQRSTPTAPGSDAPQELG